MLNLDKKLFPHPVLGLTANYESQSFSVKWKETPGKSEKFAIVFTFTVDVKAINDLIDKKDAVCNLRVYCRETSFLRVYEPDNKDLKRVKVRIPFEQLRGRVEFHPSIISKKETVLSIDEANDVFGKNPIIIPKGKPLAAHTMFSAGDLSGGESRNLTSMFKLKTDPGHTNWNSDVDVNNKYVTLTTNEETRKRFDQLRNDSRNIETLFMSSLTEALQVLLQDDDSKNADDNATDWVNLILKKLSEHNLEIETDAEESRYFADENGKRLSSLSVAQTLLRNPLQLVLDKTETDIKHGD